MLLMDFGEALSEMTSTLPLPWEEGQTTGQSSSPFAQSVLGGYQSSGMADEQKQCRIVLCTKSSLWSI